MTLAPSGILATGALRSIADAASPSVPPTTSRRVICIWFALNPARLRECFAQDKKVALHCTEHLSTRNRDRIGGVIGAAHRVLGLNFEWTVKAHVHQDGTE